MSNLKLPITALVLSAAAFALLPLVACGPLKTMEDMKNTTNDMKGITQDTKGLVGASMIMGRQGAGKDARDKVWEKMLSKTESPDFKSKAVSAISYVYAFEFQSYTGIAPDTAELRSTLFVPTMEEFYWKTSFILDNANALLDPNNHKAMTALGAALHRINYLQRVAPVSLFDLIRNGTDAWIKYKNRSAPASSITDYQEIVAKYIAQTHTLLNMRLEGLILVAIGSLSELADKDTNITSSLFRIFFGTTPKNPTINSYTNNYFELKFDADAMDQASTTLDLMERAQLPIDINSRVLASARKLQLDQEKLAGFSVEADEANTLMTKLHGVVARIDSFPKFDVSASLDAKPAPSRSTPVSPFPHRK